MDDSYKTGISLSSFHRLYRLLGTALCCVFINLLLLNILPESMVSTISENVQWVNSVEPLYFFLWGILLAPAWETLFQYLPSLMLGKHPGPYRIITYHLLAALPFAAVHAIGYSVVYSIVLLPTSFLLAYTYFHFWKRNQMPYLMTAIVHGLINLFSYLILFWITPSPHSP